MRKIISQGETLRLYIDYTDIETGIPTDPSALSAAIRRPDGSVDTLVFPHTDFQQVTTGSYFVRILGDQQGTYHYSITALVSLNDTDIRDGKFDVEATM